MLIFRFTSYMAQYRPSPRVMKNVIALKMQLTASAEIQYNMVLRLRLVT